LFLCLGGSDMFIIYRIGSPVVEVLRNEPLSDKGRLHLEKVRRNADQMLNMVNDMLKGAGCCHEYITDEAVPQPGDIPVSDEISHDRNRAPFEAIDEAIKDDSPTDSAPGTNRVKLLVVEDNDDLRGFLRDILSDRYDVIVAPNGKIGLEKAAKEQPDFIITDVTMPEMDGMTMVKEIKKNKSLSHIPIIVLSARASLADRVEGLKIGIDDYITKPFSATYLRQRISNIRAQRKLLQQSFFEQIGREMRPDVSAIAGPDANPASRTGANADAPAEATTGATTPAPQQEAPQKQEYRLSSPVITDADQEMMERLLAFMEARISDEDLKIEELAEAVNMGRTVFYGKIKALVGMSPSDFLRRLRMQRAEELIARSKMNFSQIAFNVGFSDPKYFTKCFKKETGMTPSEYRQNALRQQAGEQ
ncbi:MAG: response regulator, partial [Muribaculaceae bacterium]|nr:response regulator [Muribaculaceae bacterium]